MKNLLVLDALIGWRDDILKKDIYRSSKIGYLSHMCTLIDCGFLDLTQPLQQFIKNGIEDQLRVIKEETNWSPSSKSTRATMLRSFYQFSKQNNIAKTAIVIPFQELRDLKRAIISELLSSNEDKIISQQLETTDIINFLSELCKLNPRDSLVAWMMWEFKLSLQQTLDILIKDINFDKDIITLKNDMRIGTIRSDLKQCILEQGKGKKAKDLLFSTDQGKRIHPGQLVRNMKKASKRAKLPVIMSPRILAASAKFYSEQAFLAMSDEERRQLSLDYAEKLKSHFEKQKIIFAE